MLHKVGRLNELRCGKHLVQCLEWNLTLLAISVTITITIHFKWCSTFLIRMNPAAFQSVSYRSPWSW